MSETTTPRESPAAGSGRPAAAGSPPGAAEGAAARAWTAPPTCAPDVFTECPLPDGVVAEVRRNGLDADLNDPRSVGVLLTSEDPALFVREGRGLLCNMPFSRLKPRPEMTMIGRTYSSLPGAAEGAAG